MEMAGVRFATDYRNVSAAAEVYDPPLSFYNSVQDDQTLNDTASCLAPARRGRLCAEPQNVNWDCG